MKYLLLLAAWTAVSNAVDLPIIVTLSGIQNGDTATPTPGSPFSWKDAHPTCDNNNPTIDGGNGFCTNINSDPESYLQIDLQDVYDISSVGMVNRADCCSGNQFVKTYKLEYSLDGTNFISDGINNPLNGPQDIPSRGTEVKTAFANDIEARYLKVTPILYNGHKSFRFEAYGEKASPECDAIDIDQLLEECSSTYSGLQAVGTANEQAIEAVNDRIDNLIANSATFYNGNPDQAAAAQSVYGNNDIYNEYPENKTWFDQNKDNLLLLSLGMNILIILFGSCICLQAGVCSKAFGSQKVRYRKVNPYASESDDERGMIVRRQ